MNSLDYVLSLVFINGNIIHTRDLNIKYIDAVLIFPLIDWAKMVFSKKKKGEFQFDMT